jgi:tape measure domain-containing protein
MKKLELGLEIKGDARGAVAALSSVELAQRKLTAEQAKAARAAKESGAVAQQAATTVRASGRAASGSAGDFRRLTSAVKTAAADMADVGSATRAAASDVQAGGKAARASAAGYREMAEAVRTAVAEIRVAASEASRTGADFRRLASDVNRVPMALKTVSPAADAAERRLGGLRGTLGGLGALVSGVGFVALGRDIYQTGVQTEGFNRALTTIRGSAALAADDFKFVRRTADDLGLVATDLQQNFLQLSAATKGTGLEGEATRATFVALSRAGIGVGAGNEQISRAFTAMTQVVSKGQVTIEELRGQLSEAIPGAVQIAARAFGVTTAELGDMVEEGLDAEVFVRRFTSQLEKEFPEGLKSAGTGTSELKNAWVEVKNALNDAGLFKAANEGLSLLAGGLKGVAQFIRDLTDAINKIDFSVLIGKAKKAYEQLRKLNLDFAINPGGALLQRFNDYGDKRAAEIEKAAAPKLVKFDSSKTLKDHQDYLKRANARLRQQYEESKKAGTATTGTGGASDSKADADQRRADRAAAALRADQAAANKLLAEQNALYERTLAVVDPAKAALAGYRDELVALEAIKGRFTPDVYADAVKLLNDKIVAADPLLKGFTAALDDLRSKSDGEIFEGLTVRGLEADTLRAEMRDATRDTWDAFSQRGAQEITALGQLFGGSFGRSVEKIFGLLQGLQTGNFTSVGGKLGGALTLLSGGRTNSRTGSLSGDAAKLARGGTPGFAGGVIGGATEAAEDWKKLFDKLTGGLDKIFGKLPGSISKAIGGVLANAEFGKGVTDILGLKGSKTGAALGSVAGSVAEKFGVPFGKQIGAVLGSVIGGALKKIPKATSTITTANGSFVAGAATGTRSLLSSVNSLGGAAAESLEDIASQLGGGIRSGLTLGSIGQRKKKYTYDPTGRGKTKKKDGARQFDTAEEAQAALLQDALADGAISGLSPKVSSVIKQYAGNINKGVSEALRVQGLERLVAAQGNPFASLFDDFERQNAERLKIARKYGFDVAEIERLNATERLKNLKAIQEQYTGGLQRTVDELKRQALGGTALDQIGTLASQRDAAVSAVRGGDLDQLGKVTDLTNQLSQLRSETFGSTAQFQEGTSADASLLQTLIDEVNARISTSANEAQTRISGEGSATQTNTLLNEQTDILAQHSSWLQQIAQNTGMRARDAENGGAVAIPNFDFANYFMRSF